MQVYAATIRHADGVQLVVAQAEATMNSEIYDWVAQWWSQELPGVTIPKDQATAITTYFTKVKAKGEFLDKYGLVDVSL